MTVKPYHIIFIALLMLGAPIAEAKVAIRPPIEFYIAPNGSDSNNGSKRAPFATLEKARDTIRGLGAINRPVIVYLREGTYYQSSIFQLNNLDSGTIVFPITWQSYPGEDAVISGGTPLDNLNWSLVPGENYYVADVAIPFNSLFDDDTRLTRARTPNQGTFIVEGTSQSDPFRFIDYIPGEVDPSWFIPNSGMNAVSFQTFKQSRQRVTQINANEIELEFWASHEHSERYYLENFIAALDAPGEWYLDVNQMKLYLWPIGDINDMELIAASRISLLSIAGSSALNQAKNIQVKGLTFAHTDWEFDSHEDYPGCGMFCPKGYRGAFGVIHSKHPAAINLDYTRNIVFENNEIRNTGTAAIHINRSQDTKVLHNTIFDIGAEGIRVGERHEDCSFADLNTPPNINNCFHSRHISVPLNEWTANTTVADNTIRDIGKIYREGIGIYTLFSHHNSIVHNELYNLPSAGISSGWTFTAGGEVGNPQDPVATHDNVIKKNKIYNVLQETNDGGAIYTLAHQPDTVIDNNLIYDLIDDSTVFNIYKNQLFGIYLDEGSRDLLLTNNMVCATTPQKAGGTAPLFFHGPFYNTAENNIFANGQFLQLNFTNRDPFVDPDLGLAPQGNIFTTNIVFADTAHQPLLNKIFEPAWGVNTSINDSNTNLFWPHIDQSSTPPCQGAPNCEGNLEWWQNLTGFDQQSIEHDPLFINPCSVNFQLDPNSPAIHQLGFMPIDFSDVGPR